MNSLYGKFGMKDEITRLEILDMLVKMINLYFY